METSVSITRLAPTTVTRPRGEEAYRNLREYLPAGAVEVDLNSAELLSVSFLDGLVLRLLEANQLDKVTFVASDPGVQRKLSQVAGVRHVEILFRTEKGGSRRPVPPRAFTKVELDPPPSSKRPLRTAA